MFFATPIALFALIPWTALTVWMLWGRRPAAVVPFIDLWRGPVTGKYVERAVHPPPRAIVIILLAILLGIVAASSPTIRGKGGGRVSIVVDRGITMSALGRERPRFVETSEGARAALAEELAANHLSPDDVRVVIVPNGSPHTSSLEEWTSLVSHLPPTAAETRDALVAAVARERGERDVVIVVSDVNAAFPKDRVIQIEPAEAPTNVGIVSVAARQTPAAQLMVRVRNDSPLEKANLVVTTAGQRIERDADLPPRGGEGDVFVDLPKVDDIIHLTLDAKDSLAADNEAWLVRELAWPIVEARATVPPALARMIDVYSRTRPAGTEGTRRVAVVTDEKALMPGEAGVILAQAAAKAQAAEPAVADHPVAPNVAWGTVLKDAKVTPAPAGWTPVVSVGSDVVVAVREGDARRVWVGFVSESFPLSTDFVVFWSIVFDWIGQGGDTFVAHPVGPLGDEWQPIALAGAAQPPMKWWPGLYKRKGDGATRATNASAPRIVPPSDSDWRAQLRRVAAARQGAAGFRLAPFLLLAALACLAAAGWWWPGGGSRGLTRFSGGRTV